MSDNEKLVLRLPPFDGVIVPRPATPEFRAWYEAQSKIWLMIAREIIGAGKAQIPMLLVEYRNGTRDVHRVHDFTTLSHKDNLSMMQKFLSELEDVMAAVFVCETWTLESDKKHGSIENHPDRREAVMFNAMGHGMQLFGMARINRPGNTVDDLTISDPMAPEGDMRMVSGRMVLRPDDDVTTGSESNTKQGDEQ